MFALELTHILAFRLF